MFMLFTDNWECEVVGKAAQYVVVYRRNSRATINVYYVARAISS